MLNSKVESLALNMKVLYVEDEDMHREQLGIYLKRRVGKLFLAENGLDGLNKFKEFTPDIVITDLKMPEMDGIELTKKIREIDKECGVIITTAFSDVETILEAIDIGINKYILKPIVNEELMEAIENAAKKVLKNKYNAITINKSIILNRESKIDIENKIKNEIAHFIKANTGKGPRDVTVFINGNNIDVKATETLTLYEKKLLENNENYRIVDYSREAFYKDRKDDIETIVKDTLGVEVSVKEILINSKKSIDNLIIMIK